MSDWLTIVWNSQDLIPFAIVGSERNVVVDGKAVRGRKNRYGVINGKCFSDDPNFTYSWSLYLS